MFEYRVTKYDPSHRDASGAYRRDEWIMFSQIGSSFGGVLFTREAYQRVEDAYVAAALSFWREVGRPALTVKDLENRRGGRAPAESSVVEDETVLADVIRRVLREEFWCRLESEECFFHFGWDYYMYVGVSDRCPKSRAIAASSALFVEERVSPYHQEDNS